ncbi:MAG: metallophosphoesterase [Isosphaeraceae bacterium]
MTPSVPFSAVVAGSTLIDMAVAGASLFLVPGPIGTRRVVRAAVMTGAVFVLKLAFLDVFGVTRFGQIHLIYADLVVLVPVLGAALLALALAGKRPLTTPVRLASLAGLGMIPVGVYASWVEPFRLQLETAKARVSPLRDGDGVVRIGVLSDLQTDGVTDYERGAVARLMSERPDVILLPGDVFQGTPAQFVATMPELWELLKSLSAPGGVYLVLGDTDGPGEHLRSLLESTGIRILVNETVHVRVGGRRVTIGGVELRYDSTEARAVVDRLESDEGEGDVRVLLAHRPDVVLGLRPGSRIDLVVAGHTHGGQIVVPGFGPPMTLSRVPRQVAAGGLHAVRGNAVYVSRGVGCERGQAPRIRFLCPPEVSLVELGGVGP